MEDTIAEKLLTIAENEQNVFNAGYEKGLASGGATINNQDKTITENGVYQADEGYTGLGTVTVEVASTGGGDIDALIDGSITEVVSNATKIDNYKFYNCNKLKKINIPNATTIGKESFYNAGVGNGYESLMIEFNAPNVVTIGNKAFGGAKGRIEYNATSLTSLGSEVFRNGEVLTKIIAPILQSIPNSTFYGQSVLVIADFSKVETIGTYAFYACDALTSLVLRNTEKVCTLSASNSFGGSNNPIAKRKGYIYVPKDLVESYKTATNWSTYATQFRALEDYTVDGTITGELDESKI